MKEQEIIEIVKKFGEVGCNDIEHYIDIGGQIYDEDMWLCQIVYFEDDRGLAVYWLDEYDNGDFIEYSKVSEDARNKIETILKRDYLKH